MNRIEREKQTVAAMITIYCRGKHGSNAPCQGCSDLIRYAHERLDRCPKRDAKGSCRRCLTHCYAPGRRTQIRAVMRYSGPRMIWRDPIMALRHIFG